MERFRVYDVLYGFIEFSVDEARVIDSKIFQRLRRIKQLSLANLVYPGAEHTRFAHSLGVYWLSKKVSDKLVREGLIDEDEASIFRIAALLHDIGHLPYSHALEQVYHQRDSSSKFHELLGHRIIVSHPELKEVLVSLGYDPHEIVAALKGTHRDFKLTNLLSSDLDIDRLDYLPRDAHHTGVAYGLIDRERLLDTISITDDGRVVVDVKGLQAVESFYFSRLHMYQAVYYHKTITGYELYLAAIFRRLAEYDPEIEMLLDAKKLIKTVETGEIDILDDYWLYSHLLQAYHSGDAPAKLKQMIERLLYRRGPKIVYDGSRLTNNVECRGERVKMLIESLEDCGIDRESILSIDTIVRVIGEEREKAYIKKEAEILPLEEVSPLISSLPKYYHVERIYVEENIAEKARERLKKITDKTWRIKP